MGSILFELSEVIQSPDFAQTARHPDFPQAFTRTRKLPLPGLIAAQISQRGQSQQVTLDLFFASLCDTAQPVRGRLRPRFRQGTQSALHARAERLERSAGAPRR